MELDLPLASTALVSSLAGGIFLAAGLELRERRLEGDASEAVGLFAIWWIALSIYAVAGASLDLTAALGVTPVTFFIALSYAQMFALGIGLWGLVYYVAYVLTGRRGMRIPLAVVYTSYYALLLFAVTLARPYAPELRAAATSVAIAPPTIGAAGGALLLVLPPLVACCTYLALVFVVESGWQRMRIALVAVGTVAWMGGILVGYGPREAWWTSLPPLLALLSAWSVSWAYHPPAWLKRRINVPTEGASLAVAET